MDTLSQVEDTEESTTEDPTENYETVTEEVFGKRLTQYLPLNTTGNKILANMLKMNSDQDQIPPEFTSTVFIQQPYTATRVGTRFSSSTIPRADRNGSSGIGSALRSRTTGQTTGVNRVGPSTTSAVGTSSGTSGGTSGGTSSGGGY